MFTVEVIHQRVDDCEVEQVQVEPTLVVRLDCTLNFQAVRPVVEPVFRPSDDHSKLIKLGPN